MKRLFGRISTLVITVALLTIASTASAQNPDQVVVDKSLLTKEQLAKVQVNNTLEQVQQVGQFAGVGKEISDAVNGSLAGITDQTNRFANTRVGTYTMWIVAFKVLGDRAIRLGLALLFGIVITPIFIWAFSRNAMTRRILVEKTGKDRKWETVSPEPYAQVTYGLVYVGLMLIALATGGC